MRERRRRGNFSRRSPTRFWNTDQNQPPKNWRMTAQASKIGENIKGVNDKKNIKTTEKSVTAHNIRNRSQLQHHPHIPPVCFSEGTAGRGCPSLAAHGKACKVLVLPLVGASSHPPFQPSHCHTIGSLQTHRSPEQRHIAAS